MSAGVMVDSRNMHLSPSGERDYNHATDKEYTQLRKLADQAYDRRSELSRQSQQAFKQGDKSKAHELSVKAQEQLSLAESYSFKAAEYVFYENNLDSDSNEIDLHGLYVKEAEYIVKQRIIATIQSHSTNTLEIIVGKGLHSKGGIAKLKPAIEKVCDEGNFRNYIDNKNTGVLVVDLTNVSPNQIPSSWSNITPGIGSNPNTQGAYSKPQGKPPGKPSMAYQQQQQYQQPQQQQQQYQQQNYYQQQQQQGAAASGGNNNQQQIIAAIVSLLCSCIKKNM